MKSPPKAASNSKASSKKEINKRTKEKENKRKKNARSGHQLPKNLRFFLKIVFCVGRSILSPQQKNGCSVSRVLFGCMNKVQTLKELFSFVKTVMTIVCYNLLSAELRTATLHYVM